ncbi:hypothetical protein DEV91_12162 [Phyllobacterium brassicacearum]|nr:hypothetical protein DEV91_12162 [Phyllobacterium brassicacearum]
MLTICAFGTGPAMTVWRLAHSSDNKSGESNGVASGTRIDTPTSSR